MFSLPRLNRVLKLDYPEDKIVNFHPMHLDLIELNKFDQENLLENKHNMHKLYEFAKAGLGFTAMSGNTIYAIFGIWDLWDGVSEAWLIPSNNISRKTLKFHRVALRFFEYYAREKHTKRMQFTVCSHNVQAYKWAERCYFKREAEMLHYGIKGENYYLYARIF
tara:strand:- start:1321 stop:1812 length:492 start_codon:yes stop_codon:yes gene_type:complete